MNKIKYLILGCGLVFTLAGCKKMESTYEQYVVPNGLVYPGKVLSPIVLSGLNQAKLVWNRGTDPRVVKARIYWNYYKDSIDVAMPVGQAEISQIISNLPENYYTFIIKTFDNIGNASVPVEVSGPVYGDLYRSSLLNRAVFSSYINSDNSVTLALESVPNGSSIVRSQIEYMTNNGGVKTVTIDPEINSFDLQDYKIGTSYKLRTEYLASNAFQALYSTDQTLSISNKLNKSQWLIADYSSHYNTDTPQKMIDGNPSTRWGTLGQIPYPHYLTIDLRVVRTLATVSVWRQTGNAEGATSVQFLGSNDNVDFVDMGSYSFNNTINDEQKYVLPGEHAVRYLKVVFLTGPRNYTVMGEVDVTVK